MKEPNKPTTEAMKKGLGALVVLAGAGLWLSTAAVAPLDPALLRKAQQEYKNQQNRVKNGRYLTIVDYRKNLLQKRLWVYDRVAGRVVLNARVSHALNLGWLYPTSFSNAEGTQKSCTGAFITSSPYAGRFGYSMRINGVTEGINTNTERRAIVFHPGITYRGLTCSVPTYSFGCFVTNEGDNHQIINMIAGGSLVYVAR